MSEYRKLLDFFPQFSFKEVENIFAEKNKTHVSGAANASVKAFLVSSILKNFKGNTFWVVSTEAEKEVLLQNLQRWMGKNIVPLHLLESCDDDKAKVLIDFSAQILNKENLSSQSTSDKIIVLTYEEVLLKYPNKEELIAESFCVKKGDKIDYVQFFERLINFGYTSSQNPGLSRGQYFKKASNITVTPLGFTGAFRIEIEFDTVQNIYVLDEDEKTTSATVDRLDILSQNLKLKDLSISKYINSGDLFIEDEWELLSEHEDLIEKFVKNLNSGTKQLILTPFMEDEEDFHHLHTFSIIKYQNLLDFAADLREKVSSGWKVLIVTKHAQYLEALLRDKDLPFIVEQPFADNEGGQIRIHETFKDDVFVESFQNPQQKVTLITDKDLIGIKDENKKKRKIDKSVYLDFLTSLKRNDYVVHVDHGVGIFQGIEKRTIDAVTREYLKIAYAENDKLFVPIDQAEKVNKFIGGEGQEPKLTRLGSAEWKNIVSKVKKETQQIAKELLELYAKRDQVKGNRYKSDNNLQKQFEETFPYEETPGQIKAILDVKNDMEGTKPMDRLICGDVGFGKTEVAIRAAFKAVQSGKQVALISPITILADQHYKSIKSRMDDFDIRIEMLSRFRTKKEQTETLKRLKKGEVDIIIGTHRLLQPDVEFKNFGLVIIDEEQRFGVKQKEVFKKMRAEVDILTLTATPIPRTLNISLNGLRDITTITTPPPGRLPIITEVRRFSNGLIRETILRELERGGQVYFLHNRVQTIDSAAKKLKALVPEAKIIVTHGKLKSDTLEQNILDFKDGKYNVLVSSMIIENGIDLPNANTLIVNDAERFGLAQLYQLRGRVGRSRTQAYAYFLYHAQRLKVDAKKRLRAIVEATELGSGFQIAMKDLEIRGAGEILGVHQHGTLSVVGVSHFVRLLNQAVEDMKAGNLSENGEIEDVTIEIPLPAFIPDTYIPNTKEKIAVYQRLSSADGMEYLEELMADIVEDYGRYPLELANLFRILELKIFAKKAHITTVKAENIHDKNNRQIVLFMTDKIKPENIMNMLEYNAKWQITGSKLRINVEDLGVTWVEELRECIKKLGTKFEIAK